jgi:hypothetical protein
LAKKSGYKFGLFDGTGRKSKKLLVLRHDIDVSPAPAAVMARIESGLGIKATYFVRIHGPYNPFSFKNLSILREIDARGHVIGLHFEHPATSVPDVSRNVALGADKSALEAELRVKVPVISDHEPSLFGHDWDKVFLRRQGIQFDAYDPRFVKQMKYVSDSNARFREGCVCKTINRYDRLCILLHPLWWYRVNAVRSWEEYILKDL